MKKTLGIAFSTVAMAVSLSAVAVSVSSNHDVKETWADGESYLYVAGEKVTHENYDVSDGKTWHFDYMSNSLYLEDFTFSGNTPSVTPEGNARSAVIYYYGTDLLNIYINGDNVINMTDSLGHGIIFERGSASFRGSGSLTITEPQHMYNAAITFAANGNYNLTFYGGNYHFSTTGGISATLYNDSSLHLTLSADVTMEMAGPMGIFSGVSDYTFYQPCALWTNEEGTEGRKTLEAEEQLPEGSFLADYHKFVYPYTYSHTHDWTYTANGNKITATCANENCDVTEGLTLTLNPPTRGIYYDGFPKYATISEGYNKDAFGTPTIKYYKDGQEVSRCVKVGTYEARVTVGGVTAKASFQVYPWYADPEGDSDDVILYFYEGETGVLMYLELTEKYANDLNIVIGQNQKVVKGYQVRLFVNIDGDITEVTNLNDLRGEDGLDVRAKIKIPESLINQPFEIVHITDLGAQNKILGFNQENGCVSFPIEALGTFVFIGYTSQGGSGSAISGNDYGSGHGFCIGWIPLILNILIILISTFYILVRLNVIKSIREKMEVIFAKEVTIVVISALVLFVNLLVDLIIMVLHLCPVSIIAFILGALIFGGILFWQIRTRLKGEMTPIEEKIYSKVFKKKQQDK